MLSLIPVPVRAALKGEFHLQVKIAYTKHLNNKLAAVQATVPQAALPSLPPTVPKITPAKANQPKSEIWGNNQGKRKASDTPTHSQQDIAIPVAAIAAVTTTATTTEATTTAAAGTSSANAFEMPDSDSDDTDDTMPPACPKKEHRLTIILGMMDIKNHLKSI
jgi:hypothetical protein